MQLTGPLPAAWGQLTNLEELDVSNNSLAGQLPAEWAELSKLEELQLHANRFEVGEVGGHWIKICRLGRFQTAALSKLEELQLQANSFQVR
jgi:Leucine-rich repeat (LRR) protein